MAAAVESALVAEKKKEEAPALPDFLLSPNAVFKDEGVQWRYGRAPDYSKTRKVWEEGRKMNHAPGSLENIVENLVKNWEVEASFKPRLSDWRTIDPATYTFAMSGGPPQNAEHMLKVGTYNAIIAPNEYYDPTNSDFASSHKTFKRMMPTFAWEVMEVFSGPPRVVFRWRHWGVMKNDYVGFNNKGQKVTAKAHGGPIEIYGTTIAVVDDQTRVQSLDTYMDSLDMFRQIAPHGVVNAEPMNRRVDLSDALDATAPNNDGVKIAKEHESLSGGMENEGDKHVSNFMGQAADAFVPGLEAGCPFMISNASAMNGVEAPHPLPDQQIQQSGSQNGDAMSVDASSADTEFSDSVLVSRDSLDPETLPSMPTAVQGDLGAYETPRQPAASNPDLAPAKGGGAEMELDTPHTARISGHQSSDESNATIIGAELTTTTSPSKRPLPASDFPSHNAVNSSAVTGDLEASTIEAARRSSFVDESTATGTRDGVDALLEQPAEKVHPHPKDVEEKVQPEAGEAVIASADALETVKAKEEMSEVRAEERSTVMNRE